MLSENKNKKEQQIQQISSTDIIPNPSNKLVYKNKQSVMTVMAQCNLNSDDERRIFLLALQRFEVTEKELNNAFWLAYADSYVPSTGIEFKHIWKHIEQKRNDNPSVKANAAAYKYV